MKNHIIILCTGLIFLTYNLQSQTWFGPQSVVSTEAIYPESVFAIDIDGDGDVDVLSASSPDNKIAWYENMDGNGTFGTQQIITTEANGATEVYATDIDGDGDMDVLSASSSDNKIAWYENMDGNGTFGDQQIISTEAIYTLDVYAADMDGDGDMDVLSASVGASYNDGTIAWYENTDGNGNFGSQQIIINNLKHAWSVHAADIDGDGDMDVLSTSEDSYSTLCWYENIDGNGNFGPKRIIINYFDIALSVYAADIDGDGDMDVLTGISSPQEEGVRGKVAWFKNINGNGAFGPEKLILLNDESQQSVYATDIDGDGDLDVLSAAPGGSGGGSKISWFENEDGYGNFGPQTIISTEVSDARKVYASDIDNDGDVDVLSASRNDNKIAWYENMTIVGIEISPQNKISIYPNPTTGKITLDFTENEIQQLKIIDLTGKILFEKAEVHPNESIDLSALSGGIYILNIQTEKEILTRKIVKE